MVKVHEPGVLNWLGKKLAKHLSLLVASPMFVNLSKLIEAYWCILLGKGAGTGWAFEAEIKCAADVIASASKSASPVIFDVGANNGDWSADIKSLYPDAFIYMFEPQPDCQQRIKERNLANTVLLPVAVDSKKGVVKIFTDGQTSGLASVHQRKDSYFKDVVFSTIDVASLTIDEVIESNGIKQVDFMKMDIEGHEFEALKGAHQSLCDGKIKALSFEFGSGNINSRTYFRDFWDLLHPMGYDFFRILPSSRLMPIVEYYEDCEYFRGVSNYIAVLNRGRSS